MFKQKKEIKKLTKKIEKLTKQQLQKIKGGSDSSIIIDVIEI